MASALLCSRMGRFVRWWNGAVALHIERVSFEGSAGACGSEKRRQGVQGVREEPLREEEAKLRPAGQSCQQAG